MLITLLFNVLISNALTIRKDKSILYSRIVMITLILAAYLALNNLFIICLDKGVGIYGGLFHITPYTQSFNIFILIISAIILSLTSYYPRKIYWGSYSIYNLIINKEKDKIKSKSIINAMHLSVSKENSRISDKNKEQFRIIEYPLIVLFVIIGAIFLMSASDLISVFLSIELQSYGLYILSTLYRDSEKSTGAGLTYFLLGGLSSCFILLGSSLLYVNSGTTNLESIYLISSLSEVGSNLESSPLNIKSASDLSYIYNKVNLNVLENGININEDIIKPYYIHLSLIILSVGFLFKVSAAPFHFWSPDVYDAIPTIVTTFVAIIAKISIFIFLAELVYYTSNKTFLAFSWSNLLLISSLASLVIGSLLGLVQTRIKRLYAYSTISHVGFILLGLSVNSVESIQAYIFYIIVYTLSNLNAFLILLGIGYSLYGYVNKYESYSSCLVNKSKKESTREIDKNNSPIQLISELKGYYYINPFLAVSLSITLFSFIGVPPLFGFFAKQMILSAALDSGYYFITLIAILTSVIGAVYYLSLIKQIFFFKSDYIINNKGEISSYLRKLKTKSSLDFGILKSSNEKKSTQVVEKVGILNNESIMNTSSEDRAGIKINDLISSYNIISLSGAISLFISFITLLLLAFIFTPNEWLSVANILTLILFKT